MVHSRSPLALAIALVLSAPVLAAEHEHAVIDERIVVGVRSDAPLLVSTDPKQPRQPLPAHDGADYLRTIPGFATIRKGGTDGDPVLRGMAGSRLSVLVDGELILGGCNARMDPPTAYVFPETFDRIEVIKGPQSVRHGPGNAAGVVLFTRDSQRPTASQWKLDGSVLGGSFGRHDEVLDAGFESPQYAARLTATNATQDDYEDGDGNVVHSQYARWNAGLSLAWTPSDATRIELSATQSDGEAAYADRSVDGAKFARDNYSLKASHDFGGDVLRNAEAQIYYNYVDHVMDNYSLRRPSGTMSTPSAMNPDRKTRGGRFVVDLQAAFTDELAIGFDTQTNAHTGRTSMNQDMVDYASLVRTPDAEFAQRGVFVEAAWQVGEQGRVIGGLRADRWEVEDQRARVSLNMMSSMVNPTAGMTRDETLQSGFLRYERQLDFGGATVYAGVGHSERFPDYWELIARETTTSVSALGIDSEKNTQFDTGLLWRQERLSGSVSLFYNEIDDFLLVQNGFAKPAAMAPAMGMAATRDASIIRNVGARSWGLEVDTQYAFTERWHGELTLASVRGSNDTDNRPLPQLAPLELRLGLHYTQGAWSSGVLWRALAGQDRIDVGKGNIAGQDIAPTAGVGVLSWNLNWHAGEKLSVSAGIDNLLDRSYAEHLSRAGTMIAGFVQTTRVNEPGRTLWLKTQARF
jgi:iron complex outermembrane receptor protein